MTINNRLVKTVKCCLALLIVTLFAPCSNLAAEKAESSAKKSDMVTFSNPNLRGQDKNYQPVNSWQPYFTWIGNVQDQTKTTYTLATMGIGFLYTSDFSGYLVTSPAVAETNDIGVVLPRPIGKISYNRTPVYEWMYGYKVFSWMDILFSVQTQNSVSVQTETVPGDVTVVAAGPGPAWAGAVGDDLFYQFRSQLGLNSFMLKVNFELPWVLVWKNWMHALHFAVGVGPGWQSWTDNRVYVRTQIVGTPNAMTTFVNTLGQKYSANCVFQLDSGIRVKPATPCSDISIMFGCKYNQWGKANNIGSLNQQGSWKYGIFKPVRIDVLYSFVPYLGFQWNF